MIPIIIGLNGTIAKSLRHYLGNIPGKHEIKEVHNTAILDIAHILRKVQNISTWEIPLHVPYTVTTE